MTDFARLLVLLAVCGLAVTVAGSASIWFMDEERRIRRALKRVLGAKPDALVIAKGRGRGMGFSLAARSMAVVWDSGGWCLVYRLDELVGAELIIDGQTAGRVHHGETRRALDLIPTHADQISLRLLFDDPMRPDFDLDLWLAGDEARRDSPSPSKAVKEANQWLARIEALQRRAAPKPAWSRAAPAENAAPPPALQGEAESDLTEDDASPPWDDDEL